MSAARRALRSAQQGRPISGGGSNPPPRNGASVGPEGRTERSRKKTSPSASGGGASYVSASPTATRSGSE